MKSAPGLLVDREPLRLKDGLRQVQLVERLLGLGEAGEGGKFPTDWKTCKGNLIIVVEKLARFPLSVQ